MGFFLGCGAAIFGLVVGLLIGSVLVGAAVSFANRILGPVKTDTFGQWDDWDSDDEPAYVKSRRKGGDKAIPEPNLATGMLVTFVAALANGFCYLVCAFLAEELLDDFGPPGDLAALVLFIASLPVNFVVFALLLKLLLPTTFWRAALVAFLHYLIVAVIVVIVVGAVYLAWQATAP